MKGLVNPALREGVIKKLLEKEAPQVLKELDPETVAIFWEEIEKNMGGPVRIEMVDEEFEEIPGRPLSRFVQIQKPNT